MFFCRQVVLSCSLDKMAVLRKVKLSHKGFFLYGSSYCQAIKNGGSSENRTSVAWASSPGQSAGINSATFQVCSAQSCRSHQPFECVCQACVRTTALLCAQRCWLMSWCVPICPCARVLQVLPVLSQLTQRSSTPSNNYLPLAVGDLLILYRRPLCLHPIEVVGQRSSFTIALSSSVTCCLGKGTSICIEKWQEKMLPVMEDALN